MNITRLWRNECEHSGVSEMDTRVVPKLLYRNNQPHERGILAWWLNMFIGMNNWEATEQKLRERRMMAHRSMRKDDFTGTVKRI